MLAIEGAQLAAMKLLPERKAKVEVTDFFGGTALLFCFNQPTACAQLPLDGKANIDKQSNNGLSTLMLAARNGNEGVVKLLLQRRADTSLHSRGRTAVDMAHDSLLHLPVPEAPPAPFPKLSRGC